MKKYKQLRARRTIMIFSIVLFIIIVFGGSALLTRQSKNTKKEKNMEISEPKTKTIAKVEENKTEIQEKTTNSVDVQNKISNNIQNNVKESKNTVDNKTQRNNELLPVANPDAVKLCKEAQTSHEKNIYLTFDDGPSPNITPQILDTLEKYNVPATFFVLGSRVELYPELVKREYDEGHYIANHGYTHNYSSIYTSVQSVIDEYNSTEKAVQNALNNPEYHTLLFRFPGGSSGGPYDKLKSQAKSTLENMGIPSTNWNCLNGDAEGGARTKQQLINRLYETAKSWDSLVVLMHDANDKQTTADALPEIIEHYKAEGYTFKNYYEIFQ